MTDGLWLITGCVLGPIVGSFIGLVSLRLPERRDIVFERSACSSCGRTLSGLDLIPILSFLWYKGQCRTCYAPIPRRYLWIEIACLGLAFWAGLTIGGSLGLISAALAWGLLLIAIVDYEHYWLPRIFTVPLAVAGLIVAALTDGFVLTDHLIGAVAGFVALTTFAAIYKVLRKRNGLGGGDAWLLAAAGSWVGWQGLPSVMVWASALAVVTLLTLKLSGKIALNANTRLPFGTYLAAGLWLTWLGA